MEPAVRCLPYQQRWIDDDSRFAIVLKARQIGFTWATMLALVLACIGRRQSWYYLSASERQAAEAIEYGTLHAEAMGLAAESTAVHRLFEGIRFKQLSIRFPNGSKIVGLPANPRTARGASGNVVLDEFAHHHDAAKIWTALYPVVTRGYKVRIQSTPNGRQGKFFEIWDGGKNWSRHSVDIYQAVEQGLQVNVQELREGAGTEDDWLQEYCCEFLDEAKAWLPYSLIESAHHDGASLHVDSSVHPTGPLWLGVDVARKRDLTVMWLNEQLADVHWTRAVAVLERAKFSAQRQMLDDMMGLRVRRCGIDANGVGAQLAEEAEDRWGSRAEGVSLNGQVPGLIATKVKKAFEDRLIRIPDDAEIRRDLHQVRRTVTDAGNVRFEAPRTKDGHADRFWALGLAINAADAAPPLLEYQGMSRTDFDALGGGSRDWSGY